MTEEDVVREEEEELEARELSQEEDALAKRSRRADGRFALAFDQRSKH